MKNSPVLQFGGIYRFLSNFWPVTVLLDGVSYASVEHAYQAAKTMNHGERFRIRMAPSAGAAKRFGKNVTLRPDWEQVKEQVMLDLLRQKFRQEPYRDWLLATGDALLEEGNHWGDRYWGVSPAGSGNGQNRLGVLLMQVREELRR